MHDMQLATAMLKINRQPATANAMMPIEVAMPVGEKLVQNLLMCSSWQLTGWNGQIPKYYRANSKQHHGGLNDKHLSIGGSKGRNKVIVGEPGNRLLPKHSGSLKLTLVYSSWHCDETIQK